MLEAWRTLQQNRSGWYWFAQRLHAGDLYQACSLAAAFRAHHGPSHPLYLVVGEAAHAKIGAMFEDFDEVIVVTGLSYEREDWASFFQVTGLDPFGVNTPLLLHPLLNLGVMPRAVFFADENVIPWMQLYKLILDLPGAAGPSFPPLNPQRREAAVRLCEDHDVRQGGSVLLFPYAQAHVAHAEDHFAHLASELFRRGYEVLTSVAPGEAAISGTRPIFIPFDLLPDVAEYAGWAVGVRSGVCDILSSARCRKTFVHPDRWLLARWNLRVMNLCRDAVEFPFTSSAGTPEGFTELVLNAEREVGSVARNAGLSGHVGHGTRRIDVDVLSFADLQNDAGAVNLRARSAGEQLANTPSALIIRDLPPRSHPRLRELADGVFNAIAPAATARFYNCRDDGPLDFFEEIDAAALITGRYAASATWHTVIVVAGGSLEDFLPAAALARLLPLEAVPLGRRISLDEPEARARRLASATLSRPFGYSGLVLLDGWYQAEPWGAWTNGLHSSIRIRLDEPPTQGFNLKLGINGCISDSFPTLGFSVSVNGAALVQTTVDWLAGPWVVSVDVPEILGEERDFLIELDFAEVRSPREQGKGGDPRPLGLGLHWVMVTSQPC